MKGFSFEAWIIIVIIGIIVSITIIIIDRKKGGNYAKKAVLKFNYLTKQEEIENMINEYIPDFNTEEFLSNGFKMFCDIQGAWMNFKLENVKDIITDELYNMYKSQLETLKIQNEQNIVRDFELINGRLTNVVKQNSTITITTKFIIKFHDYIIEKSSGKIIRGRKHLKMTTFYEMKFRKSLNASNKATKCPNCGADIEMNTSGICNYCHTKLVTENTNWVLTEKKVIRQIQ